MATALSRPNRLGGLGLKTLALIVSLFVLLVVALLGIALSVMTTEMHREADKVRSGLASVRAAQAMKIDVLEYSRFNLLYATTNNPKYLSLSLDKEKDIQSWLLKSKNIEMASGELGEVEDARTKIFAYLEAIKGNRTTGAKGTTTPILEKAMDSLNVLVLSNVAKADAAISIAASMDKYGDKIAFVSMAIFILTILGAWTASAIFIYRPLRSTYNAVRDFAKGNLLSRAPVKGVAELKFLASELNGFADQLLSMNKRKAHFLAGTAHDLRTPLSALHMSIQLLRDEAGINATQREKLNLMDRQVRRLNELTSSFLDANQIESGEFGLNLKKVDLSVILTDSVELWKFMTQKHEFILKIPNEPIIVECDPLRIQQVVANLLSNAIKYSPNGGAIEVELEKSNAEVQIIVRDSGIGIHEHDLDEIFEPYRRSNGHHHTIEGIGIGLWLVKRLVQAHSGKVTVKSEYGKGTTFNVSIPISQAKFLEKDGGGRLADSADPSPASR